MTKLARALSVVELAATVHPVGAWDFDTAPTVDGQPLAGGVSDGSGGTVPDATTTAKGVVQLAGDLGGTAAAPTVPALAGKADTADLAPVATSGAYSDLTGTPAPLPALAPVATSGDYGDLNGTPALAPVATSGAYSDLTGTPAPLPALAPVATSGAYSDLTGKPTVPAAPLRAVLTANSAALSSSLTDVGLNLANVPAGTYIVEVFLSHSSAGPASMRLCRDTTGVTFSSMAWLGVTNTTPATYVNGSGAATVSASVTAAVVTGRGLLVLSATKTVNLDVGNSNVGTVIYPGAYLQLTKVA